MSRPYYCEVEYLESTGTQWINTGYIPNQNTVLKQKVKKINNVSAAFSFVRWSGSPNYDTFGVYWSGGAGWLIYYGRYTDGKTLALPAVVDTDYEISININSIVVNGSSTAITRGTAEWTNTQYPLYLFAGDNTGAASFQTAGRIYYFQVIENGTILHDFIPVLDNNKRPALFDKISKTLFYNQGTGEFSYGKEIAVAKNCIIKSRPYLCEVEYLESTGTQYIDTGIIPNIYTATEEKFNIVVSGNKSPSFVRWSGNPTYDTFGTYLAGGNIVVYYGRYSDNKATSFVFNVNTDYTIKNDISSITFNSNTRAITRENVGWTNTTYSMYLFAGNNQGTPSYFSDTKIYYYKIWDNGTLVRDFIPVLDSNSVPCLYDKVSKTLFYNKGTGTFLVGDTISGMKTQIRLVKEGRPYYCEVEYIESTGTQWIDTGVVATENTRVTTRLYTEETGNKNWFGAGVSQTTGGAFAFNSYSSSAIEYLWGLHDGGWPKPDVNNIVGTPFDVDFSKNGVTINGISVSTITDTWGTDSNLTITLFVRNGGSAYISGRIYYMKIYEGGLLIRDLVPVLDWNMKPALYDKINDKLYYNLGTSEFNIGRQIHPVEYLESTGTQAIDTGIQPQRNMKFMTKVVASNVTDNYFSSCRIDSGNNRFYLLNFNTTMGFAVSSGYWGNTISFANYLPLNFEGTPHKIIAEITNTKTTINVDDNFVQGTTDTSLSIPVQTLPLFGGKINNSATVNSYAPTGTRCYYAKYYVSGILVRDFIPAIDEHGVGFMFDRVSHTVYENVGTGFFKYPDVPLEYLQSSGTQYLDLSNNFDPDDECYAAVALLEDTSDKYFIVPSTWNGNCRFALGGSHISVYSENKPVYTCAFGTSTTGTTHYSPLTEVDFNKHFYSYKNRLFRVDDLELTFSATDISFTGPTTNLRLFYGYNSPTSCKVYSYRQLRNGNLIVDLIPVMHNGEACMYDRVSKTYLTNQGTGTFLNRIATPGNKRKTRFAICVI